MAGEGKITNWHEDLDEALKDPEFRKKYEQERGKSTKLFEKAGRPEWMLTEQDVFDGIPDDTPGGFDIWEDQALLWPAIGRLALRKLIANIEAHIAYQFQSGSPQGPTQYIAIPTDYWKQLKQEAENG